MQNVYLLNVKTKYIYISTPRNMSPPRTPVPPSPARHRGAKQRRTAYHSGGRALVPLLIEQPRALPSTKLAAQPGAAPQKQEADNIGDPSARKQPQEAPTAHAETKDHEQTASHATKPPTEQPTTPATMPEEGVEKPGEAATTTPTKAAKHRPQKTVTEKEKKNRAADER